MARRAKSNTGQLFRRPSWWVVIVSGTLLVVFLVAMVREFVAGHHVQQQVGRLQQQVATAQRHQRELKDLIDYLQSPTFQEREARLQLGLKKSGEQVIVVPPNNDTLNVTNDSNNPTSTTADQSSHTHASAWWSYFFGQRSTSST